MRRRVRRKLRDRKDTGEGVDESPVRSLSIKRGQSPRTRGVNSPRGIRGQSPRLSRGSPRLRGQSPRHTSVLARQASLSPVGPSGIPRTPKRSGKTKGRSSPRIDPLYHHISRLDPPLLRKRKSSESAGDISTPDTQTVRLVSDELSVRMNGWEICADEGSV